jgi:2-hydroxy-3-keto-5-methylthiopentenyl-1-phosphate phosphatase
VSGSTAAARWAVVCDFDDTATVGDLGDRVSIRFAGRATWERAQAEFREGGMTFSELLRRVFAPITAGPGEIAAFAREAVAFRPGFERFLGACRDVGIPFVLCSAGLDVYIHPVLERLAPELRAHLRVRCNEARCSELGLEVAFHGDGAHEGCGGCGFCKGTVVEALRREGRRVLFIGDGRSDRCGARAADRVFARRSLAAWCAEVGLAHERFESFDEVLAALLPSRDRA